MSRQLSNKKKRMYKNYFLLNNHLIIKMLKLIQKKGKKNKYLDCGSKKKNIYKIANLYMST